MYIHLSTYIYVVLTLYFFLSMLINMYPHGCDLLRASTSDYIDIKQEGKERERLKKRTFFSSMNYREKKHKNNTTL